MFLQQVCYYLKAAGSVCHPCIISVAPIDLCPPHVLAVDCGEVDQRVCLGFFSLTGHIYTGMSRTGLLLRMKLELQLLTNSEN